MKTCTIGNFVKGLLPEYDEHVYAVFDGRKCLYVGQTKGSIFNRWFSHMGGHIILGTKDDQIYGLSEIGDAIEHNLPRSLQWKMKTFSIDDCASEIKKIYPTYKKYSILDAELAMIRKLKPSLNGTR